MAKIELSPEARHMLRNVGKMVVKPRRPSKKRLGAVDKFRALKKMAPNEMLKPISTMTDHIRMANPVEHSVSYAARKADPQKRIRSSRRRA